MLLYHYTCTHQVGPIRESGVLRPWPQPILDDLALVWLTDLAEPLKAPLGLTGKTLSCDRTQHRVSVDYDAIRWVKFARLAVSPSVRFLLESAPGAMPMHWWVATDNVPVLEVA